jgi:hypothetical protein
MPRKYPMLHIRLTSKQKIEIEAAAAGTGFSVSAYVKNKVLPGGYKDGRKADSTEGEKRNE